MGAGMLPDEISHRIRDLALFPEENPFPVMRVNNKGILLYANWPALALLSPWNCLVGQPVPCFMVKKVKTALAENTHQFLNLNNVDHYFTMTLVPVSARSYVNFYGQDITEARKITEKLRHSEVRFRQIADCMPQLVWTADASGVVDYYNERRIEFEGFTQREDGSWEWAPVVHPDEQAETIAAWEMASQTGTPYEIEHRVKRANGHFSWFLSRAFPIHNELGEIVKWFGTATDIDDIKRAELELETAKQLAEEANQKLTKLACTDVLTDTLNRRAFMERAQITFQFVKRYQHPLSLLIIDIDHFKKINDTYGHQGGDIVLIEIGRILTSSLRATDVLGRIGGEEFAVILPETTPYNTADLAARVLEKISSAKIKIGADMTVSLTVSIGVATIPPLPFDIGSVMRAADQALYRAKSEGRNRYCEASVPNVENDPVKL